MNRRIWMRIMDALFTGTIIVYAFADSGWLLALAVAVYGMWKYTDGLLRITMTARSGGQENREK